MAKLRLNLEALKVESFETAEEGPVRGTVMGNEEYTYYCETDVDCRTPGHASCVVTRCVSCSTGDDDPTPQCPLTAICP